MEPDNHWVVERKIVFRHGTSLKNLFWITLLMRMPRTKTVKRAKMIKKMAGTWLIHLGNLTLHPTPPLAYSMTPSPEAPIFVSSARAAGKRPMRSLKRGFWRRICLGPDRRMEGLAGRPPQALHMSQHKCSRFGRLGKGGINLS